MGTCFLSSFIEIPAAVSEKRFKIFTDRQMTVSNHRVHLSHDEKGK